MFVIIWIIHNKTRNKRNELERYNQPLQLLKNANFSVKTTIDKIASYIIEQPIYCCFDWHDLFFCTILR